MWISHSLALRNSSRTRRSLSSVPRLSPGAPTYKRTILRRRRLSRSRRSHRVPVFEASMQDDYSLSAAKHGGHLSRQSQLKPQQLRDAIHRHGTDALRRRHDEVELGSEPESSCGNVLEATQDEAVAHEWIDGANPTCLLGIHYRIVRRHAGELEFN